VGPNPGKVEEFWNFGRNPKNPSSGLQGIKEDLPNPKNLIRNSLFLEEEFWGQGRTLIRIGRMVKPEWKTNRN